jgi:ADP-heptose:LPS heptosyltransferase
MKRILIVRTDRVGDVVMITPMIREIKKAFPDSYIATLTQKNTSQILLNNPYLDEMITDDLKKESFWDVTKTLRAKKFTHGLLVMPTERAAYQMFFAGIKKRIGVGKKLYEVITFMDSVSRNNYIPLRHEADYCMDLARKIGVKTDNILPEIFLSKEELAKGTQFLKDFNADINAFKIIIHTGSLLSAPNWTEEKYLELIKQILSEIKNVKLNIFLTAREMSDEFLQKISELNDDRIFNVSQKLDSLRDFIIFINAVDLIMVSSTGPAHIADALKKKAVVIHSHRPMNCSKHWGIINDPSSNIEVTASYCDTHCSPDKERCMIENGITVQQVFDSIKQKINSTLN